MRLNINFYKSIVISACLAFAANALAVQPKWITDSNPEYPNEMYLVGRGVGSTTEEASNRARGDLATIFEVRIEVVTQNSTTATKQSGKKEQVDRLSSQQVSATTDKVINGIQIAEVWRDPVTQDVHALAIIPRAQASASLREELHEIDDNLTQQMQSAKSSEDPLLKIGALSKALEATIKREGFQATLKIIDPSGRGLPAPFSQAAVQKQITDTLKTVRIASKIIEDDGAREFSSLIKGGLAAAGFLSKDSESAELILESKLDLTDIGMRDNWYWVRGTVEISLVEKSTGIVRGSKTWPLKSSAKNQKTARSRILIEIEKTLKEELRSTIIEFASS